METLQVRRRVVGAADSHGTKAITWAAGTDWVVDGYAPGAAGSSIGNSEPFRPNRDLSLILWTVYAPANADAPMELDRVVLGGVEYDVEGRPDDWTHGPWPHPTAGIVVELKVAEG
jgi:hypothetical protein